MTEISFQNKSGLLAALVSLLLVYTFFSPKAVFGAEVCPPVNPDDYCCSDPNTLAPICLENTFANILKGVLSLVGLGSFTFIIQGGLRYTMAGGDMKAIDEARKTLTWSVIGLGFSLVAIFGLQLLNQTFDANFLRFVLPPP